MWIKVLEELEHLGVNNKSLKRTKKELFYHVDYNIMMRLMQLDTDLIDNWPNGRDKDELLDIVKAGLKRKRVNKQFNLFQLLISEAILSKSPVSLLIFKDGSWLPLLNNNLDLYSSSIKERVLYESHTVISLTRLTRKFFAHPKALLILNELNLFTSVELKLLQIISSGEYESLEVNFPEEKRNPLVFQKAALTGLKIADILTASEYKNIVVTAPGGMMIIIENMKAAHI